MSELQPDRHSTEMFFDPIKPERMAVMIQEVCQLPRTQVPANSGMKIARRDLLMALGAGTLLYNMAGSTAAHADVKIVQPVWDRVAITHHDLGHGVHMLHGFGGNIGVLAGDDGVLMVDCEYPQLSAKIRAFVAGLSPLPIRYLINTHWHWDHTGGNENFARQGAVVMSSQKTWKYLSESKGYSAEYGRDMTIPRAALPVVTFDRDIKLHLSGQNVRAFQVRPAHTDGDVVVHFIDADVIQTGDTFFHGFYPFIDVAHGGSIDGMIEVEEEIYKLATPQTKIIPGHGPIATREDVKIYIAMLRDVRNRVAKAIDANLTLKQLIAKRPLDDLDPIWGGNLIKAPDMLSMVYADLKKNGH